MANNKSDDELAKYLVSNYSVSNGEANHLTQFIKQREEQVAREAETEGKQLAWNKIWDEWMKGADDEFDDFMRQYNKELWPPDQLTTTHKGDQ